MFTALVREIAENSIKPANAENILLLNIPVSMPAGLIQSRIRKRAKSTKVRIDQTKKRGIRTGSMVATDPKNGRNKTHTPTRTRKSKVPRRVLETGDSNIVPELKRVFVCTFFQPKHKPTEIRNDFAVVCSFHSQIQSSLRSDTKCKRTKSKELLEIHARKYSTTCPEP